MTNSKGSQIILNFFLAIFSVLFLIYFYKQASSFSVKVEEVKIDNVQKKSIIDKNLKINLDLFKKEKFKKLRDAGVQTAKFEIGKRNPFEAY